ncbi:hypothetical protein BO94DRAFT_531546 [Aspergillus sclerotioniger CBS 115572]|uniref:Uncharacterized protein n=1 Tax=Aspergillus sclerotioniger CBS 115572 TaxID=1450535 RepID=A0A317X8U3_9EURO|nr:hypothetical protein BO94DRAFT_531546 [Aspergillus sclerotioniger CBS 115572]PWY94601.1 hypothetical protein BO94DRAFT_531546 [Aspergillus sclerotioniger CBS 115572]
MDDGSSFYLSLSRSGRGQIDRILGHVAIVIPSGLVWYMGWLEIRRYNNPILSSETTNSASEVFAAMSS